MGIRSGTELQKAQQVVKSMKWVKNTRFTSTIEVEKNEPDNPIKVHMVKKVSSLFDLSNWLVST